MSARRGLAACVLLAMAGSAAAQFTLRDWTVDNGGGRSQGARFALQGTIGQHDAGAELRGTRFELAGGFWAQILPGAIFRDGFED